MDYRLSDLLARRRREGLLRALDKTDGRGSTTPGAASATVAVSGAETAGHSSSDVDAAYAALAASQRYAAANTTIRGEFGDPLHVTAAAEKRAKGASQETASTAAAYRQVDFTSNDYLGLARRRDVHEAFVASLHAAMNFDSNITRRGDDRPQPLPSPLLGSTGSRLLSGNSAAAEALEARLARFHRAPAALLFNSGYDANLALLATLPAPRSTIVYDELVHASMHDGARAARAASRRAFRHNDIDDLRRVLRDEVARIEREFGPGGDAAGNDESGRPSVARRGAAVPPGILVAVESVYSMDGDVAPLREIVDALDQEVGERAGGACLIVDEAHSTGVCGPDGRGLVSLLGLEDRIFARLHTFGKALGAHGAVVVGSPVLKEYLVNYARPLVYSTSLPLHSLVAIDCAYRFLRIHAHSLQARLAELVDVFQREFGPERLERHGAQILQSSTPIQGIIVPGNQRVSRVSARLRTVGFDVRPIRSPTVPRGAERLRVCLHAHNSPDEVRALAAAVVDALIVKGLN
ncbi:hypothetical protein HK405_014298 [Cladochytrium tenue]|nr:hypothetical protein HK405_014298 [Cladochytrium tenue]